MSDRHTTRECEQLNNLSKNLYYLQAEGFMLPTVKKNKTRCSEKEIIFVLGLMVIAIALFGWQLYRSVSIQPISNVTRGNQSVVGQKL